MKTSVIGGTYWEYCIEPEWDNLVGSGFRAASVIAGRGNAVSLTTRLGRCDERLLRTFAAAQNIELDLLANDDATISFEYPTPLNYPLIRPTADGIRRVPLRAAGDVIIAFGMLDADIEVSAPTVIFDPQSSHPRLPAGIEKSDRCVVIANTAQIRTLGGDQDVEIASANVAQLANAQIVIAKRGLNGADVYAEGTVTNIPAYKSEGAFTIGSGDVFTAVFARGWALEDLAINDAARIASTAVARYAATKSLNGLETADLAALSHESLEAQKGSVYLAAPFFDLGQLTMLRYAEEALEEVGSTTMSPLRIIGPGVASEVAPADLALLRECDSVFALLQDLDPGTVFEIGYARDRDIPVVAYAPHLKAPHRTMFEGSGVRIFNDFALAIVAVATM